MIGEGGEDAWKGKKIVMFAYLDMLGQPNVTHLVRAAPGIGSVLAFSSTEFLSFGQATGPPRSGARVGVSMWRGAGDSLENRKGLRFLGFLVFDCWFVVAWFLFFWLLVLVS